MDDSSPPPSSPTPNPTPAADHLARNLRVLRDARGLSQARVAALAGLPRATWATLEAGGGNPTLAVLLRVAAALQVGLDELIAPPRDIGRLYRAADLPTRRKGSATVRDLLPDPTPGLAIERLHLPPGGAMAGSPHTRGTREYLTCERGTLGLSVAGQHYVLAPGDAVVFRGDQRHGYRNLGDEDAVGISVILLTPVDLA
ncbi:MAG: helix-turn-helix transcriptional regulator [Alphaproteobacteria bacterium]|nr:helix-turn-helix transcriptional regulator [Alphaproteobacteria bacterium]